MKCSWYDAMPMKCKCKRLANTEGVTAGTPGAATRPHGPDAVASKPASSTTSTSHKQARTSKSAHGGARHCSSHGEVKMRWRSERGGKGRWNFLGSPEARLGVQARVGCRAAQGGSLGRVRSKMAARWRRGGRRNAR
jgi:hypothetical protein